MPKRISLHPKNFYHFLDNFSFSNDDQLLCLHFTVFCYHDRTGNFVIALQHVNEFLDFLFNQLILEFHSFFRQVDEIYYFFPTSDWKFSQFFTLQLTDKFCNIFLWPINKFYYFFPVTYRQKSFFPLQPID